ncbi:Cof-type HAD-IIB family hydrolase [Streptomyces sp. YIM 98790]|uniref:Cof-type HAD-IIB family hydrolase n=1 Tax=Streptomyces sp. YIM 98790 TaxID=2689077 RepID=UPI001FB5786E|nr:Cof-type HAD-IIB family hydrolase [Streptomyces sp. YIM 98790]
MIATDLDGTLLRHDKTVSRRTISALLAAARAGIGFLMVTGRPARWMTVVGDLIRQLPGSPVAICANGAAVVDLRHGRHRLVDVHPLDRRDALATVHALRAAAPGVTFAVESTRGIHYDPDYPPFFPGDPTATTGPVDPLLALAPAAGAAPVIKLLAHHRELDPDDFLALARRTAGGHGQITRSSPTALLEVSRSGVSKATTLARYCARLGIRREEVVAFGDMPNDLEMLAWAGTSYAMANAHPDVLAATPLHTVSNQEDGVAAVVETLLP